MNDHDGLRLRTRSDDSEVENGIADLERRLAQAKAKRQQLASHTTSLKASAQESHSLQSPPKPTPSVFTPANHFLLLLSDSALPLGSFAFSSGLESYLAHQKSLGPSSSSSSSSFAASFLPLSLSSYASTTLPFVLAAHRTAHSSSSSSSLAALDDALDATIVCAVGRRASVAQGRALLALWERSFAGAGAGAGDGTTTREGVEALRAFAALVRSSSSSFSADGVTTTTTTTTTTAGRGEEASASASAHLAPLFGAICRIVGIGAEQTAYVFLLGHAKALVSAAVRAGLFGPYQAQRTLAGGAVQGLIAAMVEREWATPVEEAGQNVPVMDLWMGRHEVLYSRIFNS
ncbi:hypothetical protein VTK56DRAFT_939 [Thermocarpiscus australiensis]